MKTEKYPFGFFNKILVIDTETSAINTSSKDISEDCQIVAIGLVVADAKSFKEIDSKYIEIRWNKNSKWSEKAQSIHGLSREYLDEHGVAEDDAVVQICEFILKHYNPDDSITLLAHNPRFDHAFLSSLLSKYDIKFKFSHRMIDSFTAGFVSLGTFNSDDLFEYLGFDRKGYHNALGDARMALKAVSIIANIFQSALKGR